MNAFKNLCKCGTRRSVRRFELNISHNLDHCEMNLFKIIPEDMHLEALIQKEHVQM